MVSTSPRPARTQAGGRIRRALWFVTGWAAVAIGSIAIVVPGLPTTVFFIAAAACFTKSSPRFERWVLELPQVGPLVRDYRAGLGMPRRAKVSAIAIMVAVAGVSVFLSRGRLWFAAAIVALILVGIWVIVFRVPTRERMLELRQESAGSTDPAADPERSW